MKITPLLGINIAFEFIAPLALIFLLWQVSIDWIVLFVDPVFFSVIFVLAGLITLLGFYLPSVFLMNIRRFPRVPKKAFLTVLMPLLIAGLLYLVAPMPFLDGIFVILAHFISATLIAAIVESVQVSHSHAYSLKPLVKWMLVVTAIVTVLCLQVIALPLFVLGTSGYVFWFLLVLWVMTMLELSLTKYYRAGVKYLAKRGYRPNAAVIVTNELGQVLLCERSDRPGTIQTVQGGIDPGERPEQAAKRELMEELGLMPDDYEIISHLLETTVYDWSKRVQKKLEKTGYKGQEQYFFLAKVSSNVEFNLGFHEREFRRVWWGDAEDLLRLTWSVKRPGIEKALKGFKLL